ncbi:MAG: formylmethanofuran--tetrahydromethanopterin N-formyltransferase, partial [Methanoregula sp.]|nr:formylmethanofuran--tetrahydromethanopterin N-formyltransferase [Methanoregula sp.]
MEINGVTIDNEFAEAFPTWVCRVIITAVTMEWAKKAATEATGFATSAIGCPCEAGIELELDASQTPDGRPGVSILICAGKKKIKDQVVERLAECVLTAPTTAVFNGITDSEEKIQVKLHFFGDGYEYQKEVGGRKCWVIPIMEGEYIGEEEFGIVKGVAGGNFFVMAENQMAALMGAQASVDAIAKVPGTITSFPGGIVASGSKVGSLKYKFMPASTNEKY